MRKVLSLGVGLALGLAIGAGLAMLFAPTSGRALKDNLRLGYEESIRDAQLAAKTRRAELEADLARRRGQLPPMLP